MDNLLTKKSISFTLFLFVNFLFTYKYLERFTQLATLLAVLVSLFYVALYRNRNILKFINKKLETGFIVVFIVAYLLIWTKIPVKTLNVD